MPKEWIVPGVFIFWGLVFAATVVRLIANGFETGYLWSLMVFGLPLAMMPFLSYKSLRKSVTGYLINYAFGVAFFCYAYFVAPLPGEVVAAMIGLLIVGVVVFDYIRKQKKPKVSAALFVLLVLVGAILLLVNWLFPNVLPYWLTQILGGFVALLAIIFILGLMFS